MLWFDLPATGTSGHVVVVAGLDGRSSGQPKEQQTLAGVGRVIVDQEGVKDSTVQDKHSSCM